MFGDALWKERKRNNACLCYMFFVHLRMTVAQRDPKTILEEIRSGRLGQEILPINSNSEGANFLQEELKSLKQNLKSRKDPCCN